MTALIVSSIAWAILMGATLPAAVRLWRGKGGDHDSAKWALFLIALLFLLFSARGAFDPNGQASLAILRYIGSALVLYLLALVRFYKRVG